MQGTGIIGAIALIILFLFISFVVFLVKFSLDLRAHSRQRIYPAENEPKQKSPRPKSEPKNEIIYLIEKPQTRNSKREKEYSLVSPKKIYMIDKDK